MSDVTKENGTAAAPGRQAPGVTLASQRGAPAPTGNTPPPGGMAPPPLVARTAPLPALPAAPPGAEARGAASFAGHRGGGVQTLRRGEAAREEPQAGAAEDAPAGSAAPRRAARRGAREGFARVDKEWWHTLFGVTIPDRQLQEAIELRLHVSAPPEAARSNADSSATEKEKEREKEREVAEPRSSWRAFTGGLSVQWEGLTSARLAEFAESDAPRLVETLSGAMASALDSVQGHQQQIRTSDRDGARAAKTLHERLLHIHASIPLVVRAIFDDPDRSDLQAQLTLGQALAIKSRGIRFADCRFADYNDGWLPPEGADEHFGTGAVNSVALLEYRHRPACVFKPEPARISGRAAAPGVIGIPLDQPRFGNRNIASRIVAEWLGAETLMPQARYGIHDRAVGLVMDRAPGAAPGARIIRRAADDPRPKVQQALQKKDSRALRRAGYAQEEGEWVSTGNEYRCPWQERPSAKAVASLQQQLNRLEWCDALTGQMDRHPGNYLIAIAGDTVVVTGIDNDYAFGAGQHDFPWNSSSQAAHYTGAGLPRCIDRETLARLRAIDLAAVPEPLRGLLSEREVEALQSRLERLKEYAEWLALNGGVVEQWTEEPPPAPPAGAQPGPGSLFARDLARFLGGGKD
jgi:hypothetical protein